MEFKLSVGALLHFLHLNMLFLFSVPLTPEHLLWIQRLQVRQSIEFTPTPLEHTPQGHLTFLVGFWASPNEPSILVLPTFILRPQVSRDVFQACNWIFKSKLSLMMTRSYAYSSSQGQLIRHSRQTASITIAKNRRLKAEPWYSPTVTSNLSLNSTELSRTNSNNSIFFGFYR